MHSLLSHPGCFVSGLYLEGADWDIERGCLVKSKPKVLVVDLPILKIIPIEGHRLKLQVTVLSLGTLGVWLCDGASSGENSGVHACGNPPSTGVKSKLRACGRDSGQLGDCGHTS